MENNEKMQEEATVETSVETSSNLEMEVLKQENAKFNEEINKIKLHYADILNEKKRFDQEKQTFIQYANGRVLGDLVEILDSFNMAMGIKNPTPEVKNFLIGFEMIANQFNELLSSNGVKIIQLKPGDEFDSNTCQAIEEVEGTEIEAGKICQVIKLGYKHNERLLRPAMVKVAK